MKVNYQNDHNFKTLKKRTENRNLTPDVALLRNQNESKTLNTQYQKNQLTKNQYPNFRHLSNKSQILPSSNTNPQPETPVKINHSLINPYKPPHPKRSNGIIDTYLKSNGKPKNNVKEEQTLKKDLNPDLSKDEVNENDLNKIDMLDPNKFTFKALVKRHSRENSSVHSKKSRTSNATEPSKVTVSSQCEYVGICQNCMNQQLAEIHNKKVNEPHYSNDIFEKQIELDKLQREKLIEKIRQYNKLLKDPKTDTNIMKNDRKEKLINVNQSADFCLNKPQKNYSQERILKNYKAKENVILKSKNFKRFENEKVNEFYANGNNNKISDGSVCAIGKNKFENKLLPSNDYYKQSLDQQIEQKKNEEEKERERAKKMELDLAEKYKKELDDENKEKIQVKLRNQRKMYNDNMEIINKNNMESLKKSNLEKENDKKYVENEIAKNKKDSLDYAKKKEKVKMELMKQLEHQIDMKNQNKNLLDQLENEKDKGYEDGSNAYLECIFYDKYGRCVKCRKKYKQQYLSNVDDYTKIQENGKNVFIKKHHNHNQNSNENN